MTNHFTVVVNIESTADTRSMVERSTHNKILLPTAQTQSTVTLLGLTNHVPAEEYVTWHRDFQKTIIIQF